MEFREAEILPLTVWACEDYIKAREIYEWLDGMKDWWEIDQLNAMARLWRQLKEKLGITNEP